MCSLLGQLKEHLETLRPFLRDDIPGAAVTLRKLKKKSTAIRAKPFSLLLGLWEYAQADFYDRPERYDRPDSLTGEIKRCCHRL